MKTFHILILLLSMVVAGCTEETPVVAPVDPATRSDAYVYYHEGCQYLKFGNEYRNEAHQPGVHSATCPNHPVKLLSAEGSGWLMSGEVFEFYSEDGSRMIIEAEDIAYDDIDEDEIYLEITGKGFTLHVSANL